MFDWSVGRIVVAVPANSDGYPTRRTDHHHARDRNTSRGAAIHHRNRPHPRGPTPLAPSSRRRRRARPVVHFTWDNRCPGTAGFARWTAFVGQRISEHGLTAAAREVDTLVAVARRLGIASAAVDVLADDTQPEPARCRAFAHTVSALTRPACPVSP